MQDPYTWLKFLHVASISLWVGGFAALATLNVLASQKADPKEVALFLRYGQGLGARLVGPASGLAILSGVAAMMVGHIGMTRWVIWGLVATGLFIAVGVGTMRPILKQLLAGVEGGASPDELGKLLGRQRQLMLINLAFLLLALWAMVLKPT